MEPLATATNKWTFKQMILLQFEWVPRSFTHGEWQPMKKNQFNHLIQPGR